MEDIPKAMELVFAEGWNQTERDWELFIENPLNVCKCAEINNKLVGTTTSYNFSNKVAWISMVLVSKDFRGLGISRLLLNSVLNGLKNCLSIKLDATLAGHNIYQQFGFMDEYCISRMVGDSIDPNIQLGFEHISKINKSDISEIIDFDHQVFGADRSFLLRSWINDYPENSSMIKSENQIKGFALGRQGNRFFQIGPVSAINVSKAKNLISHTLKNLEGKPVVIDVMNDKPELLEWLNSIGFETKREFTRMFKHSNSFSGRNKHQFVIAGPEFG